MTSINSIYQNEFDCLILGQVPICGWLDVCVRGYHVPMIGTSKIITWYGWYQRRMLCLLKLNYGIKLNHGIKLILVTSWQPQTELVPLFFLFLALWHNLTGPFVVLIHVFSKYLLSANYVSGTVISTKANTHCPCSLPAYRLRSCLMALPWK